MDKFATGDFFVVAPEAQTRTFALKLELIGGLMRIMTAGTFSLFNGLMDNRTVV